MSKQEQIDRIIANLSDELHDEYVIRGVGTPSEHKEDARSVVAAFMRGGEQSKFHSLNAFMSKDIQKVVDLFFQYDEEEMEGMFYTIFIFARAGFSEAVESIAKENHHREETS